MQYPVVLIETEEGFAISCPTLPGFHSQGSTREEALTAIREAISLWQEVAEEDAQRELATEGARYRLQGSPSFTTVPEPKAMPMLMGLFLLGWGFRRRCLERQPVPHCFSSPLFQDSKMSP